MKIELEKDEAVQIMHLGNLGYGCAMDDILDHITLDEVLAQLAEEASELAQAALKMRRTLSAANPTPLTRHEAEEKLLEEIADVKLCLHVAGFEAVRHKIQVNRTITAKAERWLKRLMERVR